jgi:hypothetical protein
MREYIIGNEKEIINNPNNVPIIENSEIKYLCWWKPGEEITELDSYSLELINLYRIPT